MADHLHITVAAADGSARVAVTGEIDLLTCQELHEAIERALKSVRGSLEIEMSGVSFCDSSGLGVLVLAEQECKLRGVQYHLTGVTRSVRQVFRITGLDDLIDNEGAEATA